jgi:aspartyl-tRNA(Asn)/glutamyl-tRNA(Gln) amidotransferase subunit C
MPVEIDIEHVARLARLALTQEEKERLSRQLPNLLAHAEKVREVAAGDVPPAAYAIPRSNVFRDDVVTECLPPDLAIAGAPEVEDGRFKVPRIVEME